MPESRQFTSAEPVTDAGLWRYVHDQLPAKERQSLRRRLQADPAAAARARELAQLDRELRRALSCPEETDEALADRALTAWEKDTANGGARLFARPILVALAAAACLVALCLPLLPARAAQWRPPEFQPLITRGPAAATPGAARPTAETAARCQQGLRRVITEACPSRALPRGLVMALHLQELPHGAFAVRVQARDRRGTTVGEWWGDYTSLSAFERQLPASAAHIAQTLAIRPSGF